MGRIGLTDIERIFACADVVDAEIQWIHPGFKAHPAELFQNARAAFGIDGVVGDGNRHAIFNFGKAVVFFRAQGLWWAGIDGNGNDVRLLFLIVRFHIGWGLKHRSLNRALI